MLAIAYGTAAPSLAVAEFAPTARQAVEPPPTTASDLDGRSGAARNRRSTTTTTAAHATATASSDPAAAAPTTMASRTHQCVGNPPRQVEDPQSPPCVAVIYEGDNGGATAKGVTDTEVRVIVDSRFDPKFTQLLFDYFNARFEFYGRRLVPVVRPYSLGDPVAQRASADDMAIAEPFAALDSSIELRAPTPWLHLTLARHGVISLVGRDTPYSDQLLYDFAHPYVWSINPSAEQVWASVGELVCSSLAGKPASHAGDDLRLKTRKFGLVVGRFESANPLDLRHRVLVDRLAACGVDLDVAEVDDVSGSAGRQAVERMKSNGVTTLLCACTGGPYYLAATVQAASFEPELLLPPLVLSAESMENSLQGSPPNQARHIFGVMQTVKMLPYQARPFFQAMTQMSPGFAIGGTTTSGAFRGLEAMYRQLMILASGIQGAGPALTPDSFAQALMATVFPNPGAGQPPYWQPTVGFGPGDHTFHNDVALAWWNLELAPTGVAATKLGSWCFIGGGARFGPGQIPADADGRFFNPNERCR